MKTLLTLLTYLFILSPNVVLGAPSGWDGNFWLKVCGSNGQLESGLCTAHVAGLRGAFEMSADHYTVEKKKHKTLPVNVSARNTKGVE